MNDEELTIYITSLLNQKGISKYTYESFTDEDKVFHELTYFKASNGWEIRKEDLWQDG